MYAAAVQAGIGRARHTATDRAWHVPTSVMGDLGTQFGIDL